MAPLSEAEKQIRRLELEIWALEERLWFDPNPQTRSKINRLKKKLVEKLTKIEGGLLY